MVLMHDNLSCIQPVGAWQRSDNGADIGGVSFNCISADVHGGRCYAPHATRLRTYLVSISRYLGHVR